MSDPSGSNRHERLKTFDFLVVCQVLQFAVLILFMAYVVFVLHRSISDIPSEVWYVAFVTLSTNLALLVTQTVRIRRK